MSERESHPFDTKPKTDGSVNIVGEILEDGGFANVPTLLGEVADPDPELVAKMSASAGTVSGIFGGVEGSRNIFKRLLRRIEENRTPEEKAYIEKYRSLEEENTFYETKVVARSPQREVTLNVKLYRRVFNYNRELTVGDSLLLLFGGAPWEYHFSKRFVEDVRPKIESKQHEGFVLNMGEGLLVSNEEMLRVIDECLKVVGEKGLALSDSY